MATSQSRAQTSQISQTSQTSQVEAAGGPPGAPATSEDAGGLSSTIDSKLFGSSAWPVGRHADGEAFAAGVSLITTQDAVEGTLRKGEVAASTQVVRIVAGDGHARRRVSDVSHHAVHQVVVLDPEDDELIDDAPSSEFNFLLVYLKSSGCGDI